MPTYQPQMTPRDYQAEANAKMFRKDAFALLMAMRTGKTKVLLDDFGATELAGEVNDLLVLAPAGVYRTWETAIQEHCSLDLLKRSAIYTWKSGASATKLRELDVFLHNLRGPRIFLVNIEALSTVKRAREACEDFLSQRVSMCAIDESTAIKNATAARTKYVVKNIHGIADFRRILSGLPTPRSPLDLFCQFEFLDPKILKHKSFWTFKHEYAIIMPQLIGGRRVELIKGYKNTERLQELILPHSHRVQFRPNFPSTYSIREVSMTKEQTAIYNQLKQFATAKLSDTEHVTATIVIAQILRMHQVLCGHTVDEEGKFHVIPENRTGELMELLEDYGGKAIIWANYDHDIQKISRTLQYGLKDSAGRVTMEGYGEKSVARFWGGNLQSREDEERQFKTDPECRFMVATQSAGGKGRTWDMADLVVYYSSTNNLEHRDQSEQRPHAVTKHKQVDYIDLIVPNTVEGKILQALRAKMDLAAIITGDTWKEWLV